MQPAVFLDRDGTLVEDRGPLGDPGHVVFSRDTIPALSRLQKQFRLFIVTHEPGIARGIVSAAEVARVNDCVVAELRKHGIVISEVYCCPHRREDECACVKPKPDFLRLAAETYDLNLAESFVVGDHPRDVALADNVGATGLYVRTGHGMKHRADLPAGKVVVPGLREAVEWILAVHRARRDDVEAPGRLDRAVRILQGGGIVAFPTETVYGLGAVVFDEPAVARVFEAKQRPSFDPLIVHVSDTAQLSELVEEVPSSARALVDRFWPGPLTLVLPKKPTVPDLATAGLPTVAVRMPRHPLALELITRVGKPIAAPSANPFGYVSPTTAEHVTRHLAGRVDMVLDGGPCTVGLESSVLSLVDHRPSLLRPGGIARDEIAEVIGNLEETAPTSGTVTAPGQTPSHYSPRTPVLLTNGDETIAAGARIGCLRFGRRGTKAGFAAIEELSADGDLREAAINLFAALHRLDALDLDVIVADPVPETGLGVAVMDRLRRAAAQAGVPPTNPVQAGV